jgi:predicted GH43/DUF377 family glycosyl hydrolase
LEDIKEWRTASFIKYPGNPILSPTGWGWESMAVTTPAVVIKDETFYMFYRGDDWSYVRWKENHPFPRHIIEQRWGEEDKEKKGGWSCIGLAASQDGIHFKRGDSNPLITPEYEFEKPWGCVRTPE